MEKLNPAWIRARVDLDQSDRACRVQAWREATRRMLPSVTVKSVEQTLNTGLIQRYRAGLGELVTVRSASAEVQHSPHRFGGAAHYLTIVFQAAGQSAILQNKSSCELNQQDLCLIDEGLPFHLVGNGQGELLLLRLPRAMIVSRWPKVQQIVARSLPADDPGTRLVSQTMQYFFQVVDDLRESQQTAALKGIIDLLGATSMLSTDRPMVNWRVQKALDFIQINLSELALTADRVAQAQHISRRRLDQLFITELGRSITGEIWNQRLKSAADDLIDPSHQGAPISRIAFANGFGDPAHFARAFKKRFDATPGQWRQRVM